MCEAFGFGRWVGDPCTKYGATNSTTQPSPWVAILLPTFRRRNWVYKMHPEP